MQYCPNCNCVVCKRNAQSAEPPATDGLTEIDRVIERMQMDIDDGGRPDQWSMQSMQADLRKARAEVERQAREIVAVNAECVKLRGWVNDAEQAAGKLQAERDAANEIISAKNAAHLKLIDERDALRECVNAADAMRHDRPRSYVSYDAARAKVVKPA